MIYIKEEILNFARYFSSNLVPNSRASGWNELPSEKRGNGDLMDLIGSLVVFDEIAKQNKVCKMDITCGCGDKSDIEIKINNSFKKINIKTSSYFPFRNGLNLYIKKEELAKDIDAYIQVFVHLNEDEDEPHVHIAGWIPTISKPWLEAVDNPIVIPRTNGHKGICIPIEKLGPIDKMIKMVDDKF